MQYAYWIIPSIWYTTTQDKYKMSWYCLLSLTDNSFPFTHSLTPLLRTVTMKRAYIKRHMLEVLIHFLARTISCYRSLIRKLMFSIFHSEDCKCSSKETLSRHQYFSTSLTQLSAKRVKHIVCSLSELNLMQSRISDCSVWLVIAWIKHVSI